MVQSRLGQGSFLLCTIQTRQRWMPILPTLCYTYISLTKNRIDVASAERIRWSKELKSLPFLCTLIIWLRCRYGLLDDPPPQWLFGGKLRFFKIQTAYTELVPNLQGLRMQVLTHVLSCIRYIVVYTCRRTDMHSESLQVWDEFRIRRVGDVHIVRF